MKLKLLLIPIWFTGCAAAGIIVGLLRKRRLRKEIRESEEVLKNLKMMVELDKKIIESRARTEKMIKENDRIRKVITDIENIEYDIDDPQFFIKMNESLKGINDILGGE